MSDFDYDPTTISRAMGRVRSDLHGPDHAAKAATKVPDDGRSLDEAIAQAPVFNPPLAIGRTVLVGDWTGVATTVAPPPPPRKADPTAIRADLDATNRAVDGLPKGDPRGPGLQARLEQLKLVDAVLQAGFQPDQSTLQRLDELRAQAPLPKEEPRAHTSTRAFPTSAAPPTPGCHPRPTAYPGNAARVADAGIGLEASLKNGAIASTEGLARYIDEYIAYTGAKAAGGPDAWRYASLHAEAVTRGPQLLAQRADVEAKARELERMKVLTEDRVRNLEVRAPLAVQQMAVGAEIEIPIARTADLLVQFVPVAGQVAAAIEAISGRDMFGLGFEIDATDRALSAVVALAPVAAEILGGAREGVALARLAEASGRTPQQVRSILVTAQELEKDRALLQGALETASAGGTLSKAQAEAIARARPLLAEFGGASPYARSPLTRSSTTVLADTPATGYGAGLRSLSTGALRDPLPPRPAAPMKPSGPIPVGIPLGADGLPRINGRLPINAEYAGSLYLEKLPPALKIKYPKGVTFKANAMPDFTPYAIKSVTVDGLVGDVSKDYKMANEAAGLGQYGSKPPPGYTWHHCEDGRTMQLVPADIHGEVKHTGGEAVIKHLRREKSL